MRESKKLYERNMKKELFLKASMSKYYVGIIVYPKFQKNNFFKLLQSYFFNKELKIINTLTTTDAPASRSLPFCSAHDAPMRLSKCVDVSINNCKFCVVHEKFIKKN